MLLNYVQAAMRHAHYEFLKDQKKVYGEISLCKGVYATGKTLEDCREELASVLEDWLLFRIYRHLSIPEIDRIALSVKECV